MEPSGLGSKWQVFNEKFVRVYQDVEKLAQEVDPEDEPYRSKYAALALLEDLREDAEAFTVQPLNADAAGESAADLQIIKEEARDLLGAIDYKRGLLFVETDEPGRGEPLLQAALERLSKNEGKSTPALQDILNTLGVVASNNDDQQKAEQYLLQAQDIYLRGKARGSQNGNEVTDGRQFDALQELPAKCESLYTLTTFYLAQVYGNSGQADKSASYSALTLDRQLLATDNFDPWEWAQNATQLSGYYVGKGDFLAGIHCMSAAARVLQRAAADGGPSEKGADVAANLQIAWGKMYMEQLKLSSRQAGERLVSEEEGGSPEGAEASQVAPAGEEASSTSEEPTVRREKGGDAVAMVTARFGTLGLTVPQLKETGGVVRSYDEAVAVFNKAMAAFKKALEYYRLEGFVTDHFNICMDISTVHKYLATFERNEQRACAIHKRRAARLEPIQSAISATAYPAIWKQVNWELGSIYREILELKSLSNQPLSKYERVGLQAAEHLEAFLKTFEDAKGGLPGKVEEDEAYGYTQALFYLGRVYFKLQPTSHVATADSNFTHVERSLSYYKAFVDYVERNKLQGMMEQAKVANEMIELIPQRMSAVVAGRLH